MSFVSVAQASARLGIDAKTLHRWLAEAQLPLQRHPADGRKKGVSGEHLHVLARLHQRSLAPLSPEPPAPVASQVPPLPVALLALPEQLDGLHAQLIALQQQLSALTQLVQPQAPQSAVPAAAPRQAQQTKPARKTASAAPRSPRAAAPLKAPAKPTHVIPLVEASREGGYVVVCPKQGLLALQADSPAWFAWRATQSSFRFVGRQGRFTAHREVERVPNGAWRAHRHIRNHSYTLRLAPSHELTTAVLEQAAATLQAHLK